MEKYLHRLAAFGHFSEHWKAVQLKWTILYKYIWPQSPEENWTSESSFWTISIWWNVPGVARSIPPNIPSELILNPSGLSVLLKLTASTTKGEDQGQGTVPRTVHRVQLWVCGACEHSNHAKNQNLLTQVNVFLRFPWPRLFVPSRLWLIALGFRGYKPAICVAL